MRREGYGPVEIARMLGKERCTVQGALYPWHLEMQRLSRKKHHLRIKGDPVRIEAQRARQSAQDFKRLYIRRCAREEWRAEGGKPSDLERLYRKYECL
jgi:hypothetical protein